MPRVSQSAGARYGVGLGAAVLMTALRVLLDPLLGDLFPFATLFFAVLAAAWYGGFGPAAVATVVGAGLAARFLLPPRDGFAVAGADNQAGLALFVLVSLGIAGLGGAMRRALDRAQALAEAERRAGRHISDQAQALAGILSATVDHLYVVGRDGRYRFVSDGGARVLGYRPEDLAGKHWRDLGLPAAVMERFDAQRDRVLASGKPTQEETVYSAPDGQDLHFEYVVAPLPGPGGSADAVVVVSRNVTDRWRAERELREQQEWLRVTLASIGDAVIATDTVGRVTFLNPVAQALTGWPPAEARGRPLDEVFRIVNESTRQPVENPVSRVLREGTVVGLANHTVLLARDGRERPIADSAAPIRDEGGQVSGVVLICRDVTAERRAEAARREAEERLAGIINHMPAYVFAKDRDGRYLLANRALARLVGRLPADFPGKTDRDFFPPAVADQFARDDAGVLAAGQPRTFEESFLHDSAVVTALTVKFPLMDSDGRPYAVCAVATDITGLKRTQEELRATADRLGLALAAADLGDWSWDAQTDRVTLADRAAEVFGIPPGTDITWSQMQELLHPDDRDRARTEVERSVAGRTAYDIEYRVRRPDRTEVWVAALGRAHYAPDGRPMGMYGVVQDVTARKRAEEAVRDEARITETLYRVGQILAADLDLHNIVQTVTDEATALTGAGFGAFFYNVLNDRGESYTLYTLSGVAREAFEGFPMPRNTQIFEPTFRGAGVVRLDDVTKDQRYGKNAPYFGMPKGHLPVRSYLAVSVVSRSGEVLGGLFFGHPRVGVFTARHERLVVGIAAQAAVAIDNARLYGRVRETERRLAAVVDHSPAIVFLKDPEGRYLLVNRQFEELARATGIPAPYVGKTDAEMIPGELAERFRRDDLEVIRSKRARTYEEAAELGGELRTGLTTKFPLLDDAGEVYAVCGINLDITARVRAEEALRQGEERLRLALDAGRMGVWDWDIRTNQIRWSDNLEPIHGLAPGAFGGTLEAFQNLIHPADREAVNAAIRKALEEGSNYDIEFRNVWPDGSVHWMAGKGKVFTQGGRPVRMVGVGLDVTARKRAEQDARFLADASAALAGLTDDQSTLQQVARLAVPVFADWCAVDMLDDGGGLRRVAVAHVDPAKVDLAHELHCRYPPDPDAPQGVWAILRTGRSELVAEITDDLLAASTADPELLAILRELGLRSYLGVPVRARGRVLGVITFIAAESGRRYDAADLAVAEDLAHRAAVAVENARLYQALRAADRRKDEFLALLGHELRNPLAPIRNALQVLTLAGADTAIAQRARGMMERQVEHLVRLVDDLLDVSRIMRGKVELRREPVELATVVARAVETSQPALDAEGHRLTVAVPPDPILVYGDLVRLAQVLSNLLNNAAKYTEKGGEVWLTAGTEGGQAVVRVRDSGIGIAPHLLPRLFDMFFQAERRTRESQGGLGIGLSLVRGLVELHGGTVEAHSDGPGQGSEFVVRLPLVARGTDPAGSAPRSELTGASGLPARRVLVVDDNVDAADSLAMLLRLVGQDVRVAYDGPSGLAAAEADPPALAFLDLGMPRMDGYELARQFRTRAALQGTVLVALTGWGQPEDRQRSRAAGFDHHLVKPVEPDALHRLLHHRPASGNGPT